MLEHTNMERMRAEHPDWIWNRSDTHAILGVPGSHEAFKTPVEPGNSFSPGVGTYGVSTWVFVNGALHTPEEKPIEELSWSFLKGHVPVLISKWMADGIQVQSRLFSEGDAKFSNIKNYFAVELHNPGANPVELSFYLAIRSFGAAGGGVHQLSFKDNALQLNKKTVIYPYEVPTRFGALSYEDSKSDISVSLKSGKLPDQDEVPRDKSLWASGALEYRMTLMGGETKVFDFVAHVHANHEKFGWLEAPDLTKSLEFKQTEFVAAWENQLPMTLNLPDRRFSDALFSQLTHLYMFTVADEPRISPVSYPLWWLRDGAYIVTALDKGGYHEFAERAVKKVAERDSFGGFGCEGDNPGQGIWMLSEHYLLTRSLDFLRDVYPDIERKAELLMTMARTEVPIKRHNEFCIPQVMLNPESDLMCLAAKDGLIMGRMDMGIRIFWINSFAYLGLRRAAICAAALGLDGSRYDQEADRMKEALLKKVPEHFGKDPRDINSAFWPTGWAPKDNEGILNAFEAFWDTERCPNNTYTREPLWTYFEAGQAHNYLLLGQRDRAAVTVETFLKVHTAPGLYTYPEGKDDENSSLLWQRTRGWDQIKYVTPHGWTAAEVFTLLRDCLAREDGDKLILGSGVPKDWMTNPFSVKDMPTYFGKLSFEYEPVGKTVSVQIERPPKGGIVLDFPIAVTAAN